MNEIDYHQLLHALRAAAGNVRRLADAIRVTEPTIRAWLAKSESEISRLQQDHKDAIVRAARHFHVEPVISGGAKVLWDLSLPYGANLRLPPPEPPSVPPERPTGVEIFGRQLASRFGPSASFVTATAERIRYLASTGCGPLTYKTVRSRESKAYGSQNLWSISPQQAVLDPYKAVPPVMVIPPDLSPPRNGLACRYGLSSPPPEVWMPDVRRAKDYLGDDQLLIVSVVGAGASDSSEEALVEDFARVSRMALQAGADAIELNVSSPTCPSHKYLIQDDLHLLASICEEVRHCIGTLPLLVKISAGRHSALHELVHRTLPFVQGYTAINALPVEAYFDGQGFLEPVFGDPRILAVVSGPPVLRLGLRTVEYLADLRQRENLDFVIIGVGGVERETDVGSYIKAGADLVQGANVFFCDPLFALKVNRYLRLEARAGESFFERQRWEAIVNLFNAHHELTESHPARVLDPAALRVLLEWQDGQVSLMKAGPRKALPVPSVSEFRRKLLEKLSGHR